MSIRLDVRLLLAFAAGLLHAASLSTPWDAQPAGWLQLPALAAFAWLLQQLHGAPRSAALVGWVFATSWLAGTFWWMFIAMHTYGGLAGPLAALAVLALSAALSIYYAVAAALYAGWAPGRAPGAGVLFAASWLLAELARGTWFTGLGWGGAAYAHLDALARCARYVGAYGVTALLAWMAWTLASVVARSRAPGVFRPGMPFISAAGGRTAPRWWESSWLRLGLVGVLAALMAWAPGPWTSPMPSLRVALLQGNIAQDEKFQPGTGVEDALRWYGEQLVQSDAPLVVAPETALPLLPSQLPAGYWDALQRRFTAGNQAALIGIPLGDMALGYTNSVVGLRPPAMARDGAAMVQPYRYDKHHLVPFGEFIPPFFRWFTAMMNIPLGDFNRGAVGQASFEWQGQRLAPNICYEDLFGEELAARFADPASAPTIFVNVSNIAWFGNTVAIDQHVAISRMRALEFERPFIRATNTGDTAVIDHHGRVLQALPRYTRGILHAEVQGRAGITPYAWWASRLGLWPLWILGCAVVLHAAWRARLRGAAAAP